MHNTEDWLDRAITLQYFIFCLKLQSEPHPKALQSHNMGETELPVGSRSSTSSLLNTAVQGKGKQYCTLSAMYLTFWSPWGITRLKSLPLPVVKAFPSNQCFEGTKMTSLHWKWDCGSHSPSSIWAEQDCLSLLQPHGHEERKELSLSCPSLAGPQCCSWS